jgi:hypothetical protein
MWTLVEENITPEHKLANKWWTYYVLNQACCHSLTLGPPLASVCAAGAASTGRNHMQTYSRERNKTDDLLLTYWRVSIFWAFVGYITSTYALQQPRIVVSVSWCPLTVIRYSVMFSTTTNRQQCKENIPPLRLSIPFPRSILKNCV